MMKRYTIDEIRDMLNEAEANYAAGAGFPMRMRGMTKSLQNK